MPPAAASRPPVGGWLTHDEEAAWKAVAMLLLQLPGPLDAQLRRDSGLTLFDYLVLSSLSMAPGGELPMSELARLANGSLSRLSNVVKRFELRGWVSRRADPTDGRVTVAVLTPAGRDVVVAAAPGHVDAVRRHVLDPITIAQQRTLVAAADRISATLDRSCSVPGADPDESGGSEPG